jgi:hypothetical protein
MNNFDLRKYLAEGRLLKEDVSKDPSFVRTKEGLKQIFQQMLSGELSGKEANDQISDFTFGQGSMGIYPDTNSLFLRQFGMGGGDFNDYIIGKFENGGFTPATQPKNKTALKIWNYLSNLKLAEGKLLKEEQMGSYRKFLKVVKSYEDEEILSDFLDSYPKGQDISKSEYDKFTEKHLGLADPEDHRGENWKYIMSEGKLLKENTNPIWTIEASEDDADISDAGLEYIRAVSTIIDKALPDASIEDQMASMEVINNFWHDEARKNAKGSEPEEIKVSAIDFADSVIEHYKDVLMDKDINESQNRIMEENKITENKTNNLNKNKMNNFDLRKYLAEGKLLKEEVMVNPIIMFGGKKYIEDVISSPDDFGFDENDAEWVKNNILSSPKMVSIQDYMDLDDKWIKQAQIETGGGGDLDHIVDALKVHIKQGLITPEQEKEAMKVVGLAEGRLLKEMTIQDVYNDAKRQVKDIYNIDVPMDVVKQWADSYHFPYSRKMVDGDEFEYGPMAYDFGTEERGDFMYWLHDEWDEMPLSKTKRMGPPEGQWDFSK